MSPSLRPSQSCPQDVCQIVKDQAGSNNNNQEPKIIVNDVTMMTSPVGPGARQPEDEEEDESIYENEQIVEIEDEDDEDDDDYNCEEEV